MCLISIAREGVDKYSLEFKSAVHYGMQTQQDGSGFAYWRKGTKTVHYEKGFIPVTKGYKAYYGGTTQSVEDNFDKMWTALLRLKLTNDDILVVHHRSGTCGTDDIANCHPFILNPSQKASIIDIVKREGWTREGALFHNGVFRVYDDYTNRVVYSDTARFTNDLFTGVPENILLLKRDPDKFGELYEHSMSGNNKVVVLFPGLLRFLGKSFIKTKSGILHSNQGYGGGYGVDKGGSMYDYDEEQAMMYSTYDSYPDRKNRSNVIEPNKMLSTASIEALNRYTKFKNEVKTSDTPVEKYDDSFDDLLDSEFTTDDFEKSLEGVAIKMIDTDAIGPKKPTSIPLAIAPAASTISPFKGNIVVDERTIAASTNLKSMEDLKMSFQSNESFQKTFQQLLMIDPTNAQNFKFFPKTGAMSYTPKFAGYLCTFFDWDVDKAVLKRDENGSPVVEFDMQASRVFSGYYMVPKLHQFAIYSTYARLVEQSKEQGISKSATKYLRKTLKRDNLGITHPFKKPVNGFLNVAGVKLYMSVWDDGGLLSQYLTKQRAEDVKKEELLIVN